MSKKSVLVFFMLLSFSGYGQDPDLALEFFEKRNFEQALESYHSLLEEEPDNIEYNYRLAICYLNTNIDKSDAIPYLEKVTDSDNPPPNALYLLGRAYHFGYDFDKAMEAYYEFKEVGKGSKYNLSNVGRQIEYCQNAQEIMKYPLEVEFTNLGDNINSLYPDYYPFVPSDESFVLFNTKRDDGSVENETGKFTSNVYISREEDGEFQKAEKITDLINSSNGNEEVIGLSNDGKAALLYMDDNQGYGSGDLYISNVVGQGKLDKPKKLPKAINSKGVEIAASINSEKDEIYFASDRKGGYGGVDIYVSRKLPNGDWSPALNLGPAINTEEDEDFPNISPDGETLYFSSKGHTSMGGYDIFKAHWNPIKKNWEAVQNVGYPINTPRDNMNFRISKTGKFGYISTLREEGFGNLDVYRVEFQGVEPRYSVVKGYLSSQDTSTQLQNAFISIIDKENGSIFGDYTPNTNTNRFVVILPPGHYNMMIEAEGHKTLTKDITIHDKSSYKYKIEKDLKLKPKD